MRRRFDRFVGALVWSACVLTVALVMSPRPSEARDLGWVGVELDPMTTALGARNLLLYIEPPALPHWSLSGVIFASDFPDFVDGMLSYRNRDKGLDIKVKASPGMTVDYFFEGPRQGWHAGVFMFLWRYEVERGGDRAAFINHIVLPRLGYRWFPFDAVDFYVDPFAGLMFEYTIDGDTRVDGTRAQPTPLIPFATVHAGYHF